MVWDVRLQLPVKIVRLGSCERVALIRQSGDTVIVACDKEIQLVKFPILTQKLD